MHECRAKEQKSTESDQSSVYIHCTLSISTAGYYCIVGNFRGVQFLQFSRSILASCPGSRVGGEREPGTHCLRMRLIYRHSGNSVILWDTLRISHVAHVIGRHNRTIACYLS